MKEKSTIYMEVLTGLGFLLGIILYILNNIFHYFSVTIAIIIVLALIFGFRILGYFIDRFLDQHKQ